MSDGGTMRTTQYLVRIAAALILIAAASAWAYPWPNYSSAGTGYPVFVTSSYDAGTDLWAYNVYLDPAYEMMAFVIYPTGLTPGTPVTPADGWTGYDYSNTAGWTNLSGGWGWDRGAGPKGTSAAFGWKTRSNQAVSGSGSVPTATFIAQNLPSGTYDLFTIHLRAPNGLTYWAQAPDPPPPVMPEPGTLAASLALLAPAGISLTRWRLRRRSRRI